MSTIFSPIHWKSLGSELGHFIDVQIDKTLQWVLLFYSIYNQFRGELLHSTVLIVLLKISYHRQDISIIGFTNLFPWPPETCDSLVNRRAYGRQWSKEGSLYSRSRGKDTDFLPLPVGELDPLHALFTERKEQLQVFSTQLLNVFNFNSSDIVIDSL